jgi:catechol 2,3-dioxygenase-like lactoylglutathione lyase family enzyme
MATLRMRSRAIMGGGEAARLIYALRRTSKGKPPARRRQEAAMEGVKGLHHVAVRCVALEKSVDFYVRVLGLAVLRRWPGEAGQDRSVWLSTGRGFLALERASRPGEAGQFDDEAPGWQVVALEVPRVDREAWEARLAAAGVAIARRSPFSLFFQDPEGNRVALSHWPEAA